MKKQTIENNFTSHPLTEQQYHLDQKIKSISKILAHLINDSCPDSKEKEYSMMKLEECVMWASNSLIRNDLPRKSILKKIF